MPLAIEKTPAGAELYPLVTSCSISSGKDKLAVSFYDGVFVFHAQWLHDARCDRGPSRDAANAFCQQLQVAYIEAASICGSAINTTLNVTWGDGGSSRFPAVWLRLLAPYVAKHSKATVLSRPNIPKGWLAKTLVIPEISYHEISSEHLTPRPGSSTPSSTVPLRE
jgi:trimethyllysine dioxygenase